MAPRLEQLTVNDVIEIFDHALGEPPAVPPGCSSLLLGLMELLNVLDDQRGMDPKHGWIYKKVMHFLTTPRPMVDLPSFTRTTNTCRCSQSPFLVRRAPQKLHDFSRAPDRTLKRFVDLICGDVAFLLELSYLPTLYRARRRDEFPTCPKDLIPYEPNACFAMLTAWLYSPEFVPMQNASHLISRIIETFQSSILIGLLSSPALVDWVLFTGELAYRRSSRDSTYAVEVDLQTTKHTVSLVKDSGDLLEAIGDILLDEEILLWVTSNHRRAPNVFTQACDLATAASHIAAVRAQEHGLKISDELDNDIHDGVKGWTSFAARLMHYHPESIPEHMTNTMRQDLADLENENKDPYMRLMNTGLAFQWKGRCYAPECLNTYMSEGRKFQVCTGCREAAYCSRKCQKKAWSHAAAPHRKLCGLVSTVTTFVRSGDAYRGGRVILSPPIEDAALQACEQLAALRKAKMTYLSEDFIH